MDMGAEDKKLAFEEVFMPFIDDVFRFSLGLTRNRTQAEDLVQDTFLKAFNAFGSFRAGSNAKSWLFRICKNHFIDKYRVKARRPVHQTLVDGVSSVSPRRSIEVFEREGIENEDTFLDLFGDEVNRFLRELPEDFRKALLLCDLDGLRYDEIADVLDVPVGTVRSRISRARAFLRERLESYATELGYGRDQ
ncbi:MAG: sigma-70 family RNA polymerase sigma factor [Planctomycetia bacterium]|jgi:RNA polymerase sigma factor (sigma-70 family)|nr:sigma-70 family RNA polymerase sigma factor [Planctomycetia bacterium]NCF98513.1 sigma-70 family RNA polymerase sigma factor [Planctomycetia bacterium]NCG12236.1 sigma-70 family RNA polymerase sigma factor [Planctomycetia bacterium]